MYLMLIFRMFFQNAFAVQLHHKLEGFFQESEGFFQELESFFQRNGRLLLKSNAFIHT